MAIISTPPPYLIGVICLIAMITLSKKIYAFAKVVNPKLFRFNYQNQHDKNASLNIPPDFLNQIPVGTMLLSTEAEILECNSAGCKLLHRTKAELYGETAFNATWQVIQADGTNFTNPEILLTPQENLVLGIWHLTSNVTPTWLLINTQVDDSRKKVICTFSDISERYKAEFTLRQSQSRLKRQNEVFLALAKSKTLVQGDWDAVLNRITETAAATLEVERVSVWLYNQERTAIHCLNLYEQGFNRHSSGMEIATVDYPQYFQALTAERTIAASDAYTDPRTCEFASVYLPSIGVTSMLDATIWLEGEIIGIVCHEHTASKRQWTLEEENFAGAIADLITLALEANQRHQAKIALRQSEAKFHNLAANVPGMIYQFLLHPDGSMAFPYVSPYCLEIFEVEPEQAQQDAYLIVAQIHPEDVPSFQSSVTESAQTLQPWIWSGRFVTPSGKLIWISGASRPEKLPNGSIIWDGLLMDISKRKQAEIELAQAKDELEIRVEQRTKQLQDTNQQLLVEIIERRTVELALKASETKFRQSAQQQQLVNSLATQIRNSLDLDTILATTVTQVLELLQIDRCGFMWYENSSEGEIWRLVKQVHSSELPPMVDSFPVAAVRAISDKLLKLEILQVDDVEKLADTQLSLLLQAIGNKAILSLPIQTDYGKIGVLSCGHCCEPRCWDDSEIELLQAVVNQLAIAINQAYLYTQAHNAALSAQTRSQELQFALEQLQKTQSQLIQSEKMSSLGQMVAGIAHEINNPITFISGNLVHANQYTLDLLSLLRIYEEHYPQKVPAIEKFKQTIELEFIIEDLSRLFTSMQVGAQRIKDIVLSLRNFSRLDEADMKCVNLHEGIDSTLLILQHRLNSQPHQPIQIIKQYGDLPQIECYPGKLNQVFMNILTNAIEAFDSPFVKQPDPTISICTEITPKTARIRIGDNGQGMSKETIERIFDPFFTTKPIGSGTGLGLSISYQIIVENHKGAIACKSEIGKGSEFTIEIPIHQKNRRGGFTNNIKMETKN